jgi:hypothetical protein
VELDVLDAAALDVLDGAADDVEEEVELGRLELDDGGLTTGGQVSDWMKLELSIIDAPRANRPPILVASASAVIETAARTLPIKSEPNPRVALVPTFQNTLQALPPPVKSTADPVAVVKVLPI